MKLFLFLYLYKIYTLFLLLKRLFYSRRNDNINNALTHNLII